MHIVLFFTFDISLKNWKDTGLLQREVKIYEEIVKKGNHTYTFVTYGDESDFNIKDIPQNIEIIPAYTLIKRSNNKMFRFLNSFKLPFLLKKEIANVNIIKTNQLNGSWVAIVYKFLTRKKLIIRTGFNSYNFAKLQNKSFYIKSGYFDIGDGDNMLFMSRFVPDFKNQVGNLTVHLLLRAYPQATASPSSLDPYIITPTTQKVDTRARGRQISLRIESDEIDTNWRYGTMRVDIQPDGLR